MKANIYQLELALRDLPYGTRLSFQELSTMAGADVLTHRSIIACVNRHLSRHHNRHLASIRGFGYMLAQPNRNEAPRPGKRRGYLILDVMPFEPENEGKQALLVFYRDLNEEGEDAAIRKAAPLDTSVIEILKGRLISGTNG